MLWLLSSGVSGWKYQELDTTVLTYVCMCMCRYIKIAHVKTMFTYMCMQAKPRGVCAEPYRYFRTCCCAAGSFKLRFAREVRKRAKDDAARPQSLGGLIVKLQVHLVFVRDGAARHAVPACGSRASCRSSTPFPRTRLSIASRSPGHALEPGTTT